MAPLDYSTEHGAQYVLRDPAINPSPPAHGPPANPPPSLTSSLKALPWADPASDGPRVLWASTWAPIGVSPAAHYATSSAIHGSKEAGPLHKFPICQRPKAMNHVRYLQAPYMPEFESFSGKRPTSSTGTFQIFTDAEGELLDGANRRLGERTALSADWTAARATTAELTPVADHFLTSTQQSFFLRPKADGQQHRLRGFTTSKHIAGQPLNSTPQRCVPAPLAGGSSLHRTQFLGMRAPDGTRRLLEVTQPGQSPVGTDTPPQPAGTFTSGYPVQSQLFVSSQPKTTSNSAAEQMDASHVSSHSGMLAASRQPWPKEVNDSTQHRRPFAMGYRYGHQNIEDFKTTLTKAQAAKFAHLSNY